MDFNLLQEPWIVCYDAGGTRHELSMVAVFETAHELREVYSVSPLITLSVMRLLLAVAQRVYHPADRWEWAQLYRQQQWDTSPLLEYLAQWEQRFNLLDSERPFYQVAEFHSNTEPRMQPVSQLVPNESSGANKAIFDHSQDSDRQRISLAAAARRLVAAQATSVGFGRSHKFEDSYYNFRDAPAARGATLFITGNTLFETMLFNLRAYPDPNSRLPDTEADCPAWEAEPHLEAATPRGYLDYLTWQSLQVRLHRSGEWIDGVQRIQGRRISKVLDPLKSYRVTDKATIPLGFKAGRSLWRDSVPLFQLQDTEKPLARTEPAQLLARLVYPGNVLRDTQRYAYQALGIATAAGKAANIVMWRDERLPLPRTYFEKPAIVAWLQQCIQRADKVWWQLNTIRNWVWWLTEHAPDDTRSYWDWYNDSATQRTVKQATIGYDVSAYWSTLGAAFNEVIRDLPQAPEATYNDWSTKLRQRALNVLAQTIQPLTQNTNTIHAAVRGQRMLGVITQDWE